MDSLKYFYKNVPHLTAKNLYSNKKNIYYFLKNSNQEFISASLEFDIWSTRSRNEKRLVKDYKTKFNVILIISNGKSLLGYALMKSRPGSSTKTRSKFSKIKFDGPLFDISWIRCVELNANEYSHILNKYNRDRTVAIGKDGDEIDRESGYELCRLFENKFNRLLKTFTKIPNRKPFGAITSSKQLASNIVPPIPGIASLSSMSPMNNLPAIPMMQGISSLLPDISPNFILSTNQIESIMKINNRKSVHDISKMQRSLKGANVYSLDMAAEFNPALIIFPIDLSNMSYDTYISVYNFSHEYWLKMPEDFDFLSLTSFKT